MELTRRKFITTIGLAGLANPAGFIRAFVAEAESYNNQYFYEGSGQFGMFPVRVPLTLTEKVDWTNGTYELHVEGGKQLIFWANIYSKGVIDHGMFKPLLSKVYLKGIIPLLRLHQDVAITYNYATSNAFIQHGNNSWLEPLKPAKHLDDLGSAYLNYKYKKYKKKNPFEVWLLAASSKKRGYTKLVVTETVQPDSILLATRDLSNFLKGVDTKSITSARLSLEQRLVEEARFRVHGRDAIVRKI